MLSSDTRTTLSAALTAACLCLCMLCHSANGTVTKEFMIKLCSYLNQSYLRNPSNPTCTYIWCINQEAYTMSCPVGTSVDPHFHWGEDYPCTEMDETHSCMTDRLKGELEQQKIDHQKVVTQHQQPSSPQHPSEDVDDESADADSTTRDNDQQSADDDVDRYGSDIDSDSDDSSSDSDDSSTSYRSYRYRTQPVRRYRPVSSIYRIGGDGYAEPIRYPYHQPVDTDYRPSEGQTPEN